MTEASLSKPRILLVDDEPLLLGVLRREIERLCPGATIVYALSSASAVWQLHNTAISMVITDLRMHGDDDAGWKVVDAAQSQNVRVVVLTSAALESPQRRSGGDVPVCGKGTLDRKRIAEIIEPAIN